MKEITRYCVFILVAIFVDVNGNAFAQAKLIPKEISIQVPMMVHYRNFSTVYQHGYDHESNSKLFLDFSISSYSQIKNYSVNGDTIVILYANPLKGSFTTSLPGITTIRFIVDSAYSRFKSFYIGSLYDTSFSNLPYSAWEHYNSFIQFSSLDYKLLSDSIFILSKSGVLDRKDFDTADYYYYGGDRPNGKYVDEIEGEVDKMYSLRIDTLSSVTPDINYNAGHKSLLIFLSIDHSIHFSFPKSNHSQILYAYDILGREVKRIEIPSGVSEYRLERGDFMSGYYFARLGSQTASFIVN